jgi:hypothetical protein
MIPFEGRRPEENGFFYAKTFGMSVNLTTSIERRGDAEPLFDRTIAAKLIDLLTRAIQPIEGLAHGRVGGTLEFNGDTEEENGFFEVVRSGHKVAIRTVITGDRDVRAVVGKDIVVELIGLLRRATAA